MAFYNKEAELITRYRAPLLPLLVLLCQATLYNSSISAQTKINPNQIRAGGAYTIGTINGICMVDGTTNTTLAAAVACAGTNGVVEVPMFAVPILTGNVTVPIGVTLRFDGGSPGIIQLGNFNLTINGPLIAPLQQIFSYTGSGVVSMGSTAVGAGVYPQWWGAVADGATDSAPSTQKAINAISAGIGTVLFPHGLYRWNSTVTGGSGLTLAGVDQPERWRLGQFNSDPTKILYYGSGSAISVTAATGVVVDTFCIRNLHIDGTNASGSVDGLLLTATSGGGAAIEGVTLQNVTVANFPRYQIHITGLVFDVSSYRLTLHNQARAVTGALFYSDNLAATPSQFTFDDAYILPYTAGQWGVIIETSQDTRFIGGTISGQVTTPGANGVFLNGGCDIYGTHFEGVDNTSTGNVAIRYTGSNGCRIHPDFSNFWGYQIQVGMPTGVTYTTATAAVINSASAARGAIIGGDIAAGANVANSGAAVLVSAGGSRRGTIIETLGYPSGSAATVADLRASGDGVNEVTYMHDGQMQVPGSIIAQSILQIFGAASSFNANALLISPVAPTIAGAGCGGSAASIPSANSTAAFKINVGSTPGSACTITMPTATTGWNCFATDITTNSTNVFLQKQTGAESTTSVTITNFNDVAAATAFTANDILKVSCHAD